MSGPSTERGFTLVEVMIAFAILAVVLTGVFRAMALGNRGAHESAARIEAVRLAESKLDTMGILDAITEGTREGRFNERYRWEIEVTPYAAPDPNASVPLKRPHWVELTVLWPHRDGKREWSVTLRTIKLAEQE
ncbi:MAG: prepilin-type N-terminal cleavage/methylation domain-containing protein [Pseudomonadota bacterium]